MRFDSPPLIVDAIAWALLAAPPRIASSPIPLPTPPWQSFVGRVAVPVTLSQPPAMLDHRSAARLNAPPVIDSWPLVAQVTFGTVPGPARLSQPPVIEANWS